MEKSNPNFNLDNLKDNFLPKIQSEFIKVFPSCAINFYRFIIESSGVGEILILVVGLFYCFLGIKAQKVSKISLIFFLSVSITFHYFKNLTFLAKPFEKILQKVFTPGFLNSNYIRETLFKSTISTEKLITVLVFASSITVAIFFLISWIQIISFIISIILIYMAFELPFSQYFDKSVSIVYCLAFSLIISSIIHVLRNRISNSILSLILCFIGTLILFILLDKKQIFKNIGFEKFYKGLIKGEVSSLKSNLMYSLLTFTTLSYLIQIYIL